VAVEQYSGDIIDDEKRKVEGYQRETDEDSGAV